MSSSPVPSSNGGGGGVTNVVAMVPFFHFDSGDYLLFKTWRPQSGRAIAGACVGLFVFALFERWVSAVSSALILQWRQKSSRTQASTQKLSPEASSTKRRALPLRTIPPFNAKVDILRGILYAFRSLLGYTLMLVVMTYHAGYLLSIIVGLVLGEVIFGRVPQGTMKTDD